MLQMGPVVGRPVGESEHHLIDSDSVNCSGSAFPDFTRWSPIRQPKHIVEPPDASEARSQRNGSDGQTGLVEKALGEMQAARLCDGDRRRAHVLNKQPMQMTRAHPQPLRESIDTV